MAGAVGERSLVLLLFSWLLRVSPSRPGTFTHLSSPQKWVLPLQLNSGVEDKVRRETLGVLGGYRCDVRHIQLLLSSKASYQEEEWPGHSWSGPFDTSQSMRGFRSVQG